MAQAKALGKGLSALLGNGAEGRFLSEKLYRVPVSAIRPDPDQPRGEMDAEALRSLADSVRAHGILQPLLLKAVGDVFQIIAGERRWRAAVAAGLDEVPARVVDVSEANLREMALIENIQREDLSPLEVAAALSALLKTFGLTQEDVAGRIGWSRATVANRLRLLNLPEEIKKMMADGRLSEGHARALLALPDAAATELAARAADGQMTVRQLEAAVKNRAEPPAPPENPAQASWMPLPPNLGQVARDYGVKLKIGRQGDFAKVVLSNLKGIDDARLAAALEDCLRALYPDKK